MFFCGDRSITDSFEGLCLFDFGSSELSNSTLGRSSKPCKDGDIWLLAASLVDNSLGIVAIIGTDGIDGIRGPSQLGGFW
jgi:hypothetical protein